MRFTIRAYIIIFIAVFFAGFIRVHCNVEGLNPSSKNSGNVEDITVTCIQHDPQTGDAVLCEDGYIYQIKDTSRYSPMPAEQLPVELVAEVISSGTLDANAIHFSDISGDYLFAPNLYEMYWMLYTFSSIAGSTEAHTQFFIPEDAVPTVSEVWDSDQFASFSKLDYRKTYCFGCWDIYKNGAYQKTVYLTAAI